VFIVSANCCISRVATHMHVATSFNIVSYIATVFTFSGPKHVIYTFDCSRYWSTSFRVENTPLGCRMFAVLLGVECTDMLCVLTCEYVATYFYRRNTSKRVKYFHFNFVCDRWADVAIISPL
jgi:hypothetical protein